MSDNARLAVKELTFCDIPGRGDGIGRRSGLKHRRRKAWGFDFPPRHQIEQSITARFALIGQMVFDRRDRFPMKWVFRISCDEKEYLGMAYGITVYTGTSEHLFRFTEGRQ